MVASLHILTIGHTEVYLHHEFLLFFALALVFGGGWRR